MFLKKFLCMLGTSTLITHCAVEPSDNQSSVAATASIPPAWQISASDAEAIQSKDFEVKDGKKWPVSKAFASTPYSGDKIPSALIDYLWPFTDRDVSVSLVEKGFLHTGVPINSNYEKSMISKFEALSTWVEIRAPYGDPVYTEAFTTDEAGNRIADQVDGVISGNTETIHGRVKFNSPNSAVPMVLDVVMNRSSDGALHIRIHNTKNVSMFPLGAIILENKMQIALDMYPYGNGWLMYTGALLKLQKFENAEIGPKIISFIVEGTMAWIKEKVVQPVPG